MAKIILLIVLAITSIMNANNLYDQVESESPICAEGIHLGEDVCLLCGATIENGTPAIAAQSENFCVDEYMMSYFVSTTIQPYSEYFGYLGVDTTKSLKTQMFDATTSWYDYFVDSTKDYVGEILILCEYAKENGIALDDEAQAYIDSSIASIKELATQYGYTTDAYISAMFGDGVTEDTVRRCIELEMLSGLAYDAFCENVEYTSDELLAYRDANPELFSDDDDDTPWEVYARGYMTSDDYEVMIEERKADITYDDDVIYALEF